MDKDENEQVIMIAIIVAFSLLCICGFFTWYCWRRITMTKAAADAQYALENDPALMAEKKRKEYLAKLKIEMTKFLKELVVDCSTKSVDNVEATRIPSERDFSFEKAHDDQSQPESWPEQESERAEPAHVI